MQNDTNKPTGRVVSIPTTTLSVMGEPPMLTSNIKALLDSPEMVKTVATAIQDVFSGGAWWQSELAAKAAIAAIKERVR